MADDIKFMSATAMVAAIRDGSLQPSTLIEATLSAIEASQPSLNAFLTVCSDEAMDAAEAADKRLLDGAAVGPLHGIPFFVKDLTPTAGVRTTYGSRLHVDTVPSTDAVAVARLKAAGAILVGKTTTPEFGHKPFTDAPLFGTTMNPWSHQHTCGGSSGGTAAAVAAGLGPLGLGTDGGGSVRIPATCCGIVGLKATLGRVPHVEAPDSFNTVSHVGPMTRTVADARLMLEAMAGPDERDVFSLANWHLPSPRPSPEGLRIGWLPKVGDHAVEPEVEQATHSVVAAFAEWGATVEQVEVDFVAFEQTFLTIMRTGLHGRFREIVAARASELNDTFVTTVNLGADVSASDLHVAFERRTLLYRTVAALLDRFDVLVSPTLTAPALPLGQGAFDPVTIAGRPFESLRSAWNPYTYVFNLTGHPALSVPCGWTASGLPIGIQFAGRLGDESTLLDLAEHWETERPWQQRRPPTHAG